MGSLPTWEQRRVLLAVVVRVPGSPGLSGIPLRGQLLARTSFPSKLRFYFWVAVPVGGNTQDRMGNFEPAFNGAGMTCKGTDPALDCSAMLVLSWPLFSRPPGAIMQTMHDPRPSALLSLQRETCSSACPPGRSGALPCAHWTSHPGFAQVSVGSRLRRCEAEHTDVRWPGVVWPGRGEGPPHWGTGGCYCWIVMGEVGCQVFWEECELCAYPTVTCGSAGSRSTAMWIAWKLKSLFLSVAFFFPCVGISEASRHCFSCQPLLVFREGFGRHHRDFPTLGLLSKAYFPSVLFIHFLHFLLRAQLKIPVIVAKAEIFICWLAVSQRLGDTTSDRSGHTSLCKARIAPNARPRGSPLR